MLGYKALEKGLKNRYGFSFEIGNKYILDGELKWRENGFHFCTNPEDTLRYVNAFKNEIDIVLVSGTGDLVTYNDEYYGFYDMYASSIIEIKKIIPREEFFKMVIDSKAEYRIKRFISLTKMNKDEKKIVLDLYPNLSEYLDYYQNEEYVLKRKREKY